MKIKEITVVEFKKMKDTNEDFQLIDVREAHEVEIASIGGELIPMGTIMENIDKISKTKKVIIHCRSGARSGSVVQALESQYGFTNLYNLKGGLLAYAKEIDNSIPIY